jgi:transcriptional regulator
MNKNITKGSSFDSFLQEENLLAETEALAFKQVFVWSLLESMKKKGKTKTEVAKRMNTSRTAITRMLDPYNTSINLMSIEKAAIALGKKVRIQLEDIQ